MIKLFWCERSRAMRGAWLLEELGVPYELVRIDVRSEDPKPADFRKASPMGKVPAIQDGDTSLAESAAFSLYLADKYTDAGLAPLPDAPDRGDYLYWMIYTPGTIEPAMGEKFSGIAPNKLAHGWGDFPTMIQVLEGRLRDRTWLLGDSFCAADVLVGSSVNFMKMFGALPDSPILDAYLERCKARPAFARAMAHEAAYA
ncbi:MAG: glutathione S-transferase family protein [Alphaproteobacteria bacterium]|nr:MAG: glutathione S-transferase family protein [Alphaproteobacteria bacterium]